MRLPRFSVRLHSFWQINSIDWWCFVVTYQGWSGEVVEKTLWSRLLLVIIDSWSRKWCWRNKWDSADCTVILLLEVEQTDQLIITNGSNWRMSASLGKKILEEKGWSEVVCYVGTIIVTGGADATAPLLGLFLQAWSCLDRHVVHWLDKTAARICPVQVARTAAGTGLLLFLLTTQCDPNVIKIWILVFFLFLKYLLIINLALELMVSSN